MARLETPDAFLDKLRALSEGRQQAAITRLEAFIRDPENPLLRKRPLRCAPGYWLIDSFRNDRIILRHVEGDHYVAADVGGHDIYVEWEANAGPPVAGSSKRP